MDRIEALEEHWLGEPPVQLLVAAFLGFKKPAKKAAAETAAQNKAGLEKIFSMFPTGVIR